MFAMTTEEKIQTIVNDASKRLLSMRREDGMWEGYLSSSAISTSVSIFALSVIDHERYQKEIERGILWLRQTMKPEGAWGDSIESPVNMTATLLSIYIKYPKPPNTIFVKRWAGKMRHSLSMAY